MSAPHSITSHLLPLAWEEVKVNLSVPAIRSEPCKRLNLTVQLLIISAEKYTHKASARRYNGSYMAGQRRDNCMGWDVCAGVDLLPWFGARLVLAPLSSATWGNTRRACAVLARVFLILDNLLQRAAVGQRERAPPRASVSSAGDGWCHGERVFFL